MLLFVNERQRTSQGEKETSMKRISKHAVWLLLAVVAAGLPGQAFAVTFTIGSEDIQNNAVQTSHLAQGAVTNDKIAAGTITADRLAFNPGGKYARLVIVAQSGGDFTDPVAAVNSITDASETNPYLVKIMPGVYDLGTGKLVMRSFVDVAGSGAGNTVIKTSNNNETGWTCTEATVVMAGNSTLSDIKVVNNSPATESYLASVAIAFNDGTAEARDVKVVAGNAANRSGNVNGICASGEGTKALVKNAYIETHNNGDQSSPITVHDDASVTALNSKLSAYRNGTGTIDAINAGQASTLTGKINVIDSVIETSSADGGAIGIYNSGYNVKVVNSAIILNVGAGWARPYRTYNTGSFEMYSSRIFSDATVTYQDSSVDVPSKIAASRLPGDRTGLANIKLVHNYDENFDPIDNQ
jgi:hypothetical protein